jgi:hypothetical protein
MKRMASGPKFHTLSAAPRYVQALLDPGLETDTTSYHNMTGGCATHMCQLGFVPNQLCVTQLDDKRGFGVVAGEHIRRGQFVCEYVGELITRELAQKREKVRLGLCPWKKLNITREWGCIRAPSGAQPNESRAQQRDNIVTAYVQAGYSTTATGSG